MTEELIKFLNKELYLDECLSNEDKKDFYSIIKNYLNNRSKIETLEKNILSLRKIFYDFGLSNEEIIEAIKNNPSYIHADKIELVIKFYLLGKVVNSKTNISLRNFIIINKGKYLRTNYNVIYARIKHLIHLQELGDIIRNEKITPRKIFKITNEEFETSYGLSRDKLLERYPFTIDSVKEIQMWEENRLLLEGDINVRSRTK